jgi:biopolymer transport protein ExbD
MAMVVFMSKVPWKDTHDEYDVSRPGDEVQRQLTSGGEEKFQRRATAGAYPALESRRAEGVAPMARKRHLGTQHPGELNLTAMIDVAFQLLSFFLLAIKPVDVFACLEAGRPSPAPDPAPVAAMIRLTVLPGQYLLNDVPLTLAQVDHRLQRYAATDRTQTIVIQCARRSTHRELVQVLDSCASNRMTSISVVSSAGI